MKMAHLLLTALLAALASFEPPAAIGEAATPVTLDNGILRVQLGDNGLERIHDKTTGQSGRVGGPNRGNNPAAI
jgi:hypothetical protein